MAAQAAAASPKPRLVLDADTANEIDDLFAITRMLRQDRFEVVALNSTQWFHYLAKDWIGPTETTVQASQRYNEELLQVLGRLDLPHPQGSEEPLGKPWGGFDPKDSAAAQAIIEHARATPSNEKLTVVCLGAATNLATAIQLAPDIVPRLRCYVLGFRYEPERAVWNKSEFNIRRDLNAADLLLDTAVLELHVMPANIAEPLTFDRQRTWRRHQEMGEVGRLLTSKWRERFGDFATWVMWDLALVEAILEPLLATERLVANPPENTSREVWVYDSINPDAMRDDYWQAVTRP
ncbi:nucleoside hydrolase [Botrimarina hoheduenensis]|uniref:nucleoside hydrolase n=1 Tax=Botrimarina hoheduenensis TaxID=2528000 RepID=UPI0018D3363D|nr:nucleoside hydrolase [Botrimarina hoheduenensis]